MRYNYTTLKKRLEFLLGVPTGVWRNGDVYWQFEDGANGLCELVLSPYTVSGSYGWKKGGYNEVCCSFSIAISRIDDVVVSEVKDKYPPWVFLRFQDGDGTDIARVLMKGKTGP